MHPHGQNVLVVRAIEHADVARRWECLADPPQIVVGEFLLGRLAEAGIPDTLWIASSHNVFDDAALACGVHALQHQEDLAGVAGPAARVEHFLQFGEHPVALVLQVARVALLAGEPGCGVRVDVGDLTAGPELQQMMRFVSPERREVGVGCFGHLSVKQA